VPSFGGLKMGGRGSGNFSRVEHIEFEELIKKSLVIQHRFFDDENIPLEKKVEYASRYLAKRVGEKIDLAVTHQLDADQMKKLIERVQKYSPRVEYVAGPESSAD
jgi:tetrahydromethanopterin S-methyltransferase subunit G